MTDMESFKAWVNQLPDTGGIAVDDGGLSVVHLSDEGEETGPYFEIGGIPLPEDG